MLALVTGGNRGIGFATCKGLAEAGIKVLLGSRDNALGIEAAKDLQASGLDVTAINIDVSDKLSIDAASKKIHDQYGGVDILVNNAAIYDQGSLIDVSDDLLQAGFNTNLMGPIYCIRAFVPKMVERNFGRIVNVSSDCGSFSDGLEGPAVYCISKAALNAVSLTTSHSLPANVKINSVCPGWVHTRMGGSAAPRTPEQGADSIIWLATLPENGPTGQFFRNRKRIDW